MGICYENKNNCCKCNCYCPQPCQCPCPEDCAKIEATIQELVMASSAVLTGLNSIYQIFNEPNTCTNLCNSEMLIEEILAGLKIMFKLFKKLADYFNCECFYCYNHVYRSLPTAMAEIKGAIVFWKYFIELLKCNDCECVECDAFHFTRETLLRTLAADVEIKSLVTLFKETNPC